jgi:hypothetical protein
MFITQPTFWVPAESVTVQTHVHGPPVRIEGWVLGHDGDDTLILRDQRRKVVIVRTASVVESARKT